MNGMTGSRAWDAEGPPPEGRPSEDPRTHPHFTVHHMTENDQWDQFVQENWALALESMYGREWRTNRREDVRAIFWWEMAQRSKSNSESLSDSYSPSIDVSTSSQSNVLTFGSFQQQRADGEEEEFESSKDNQEDRGSSEISTQNRSSDQNSSLFEEINQSKTSSRQWTENLSTLSFHPLLEKLDMTGLPLEEIEDLHVHKDKFSGAFLQSEPMNLKPQSSGFRESRQERRKVKRSGGTKRQGEEIGSIDSENHEQQKQASSESVHSSGSIPQSTGLSNQASTVMTPVLMPNYSTFPLDYSGINTNHSGISESRHSFQNLGQASSHGVAASYGFNPNTPNSGVSANTYSPHSVSLTTKQTSYPYSSPNSFSLFGGSLPPCPIPGNPVSDWAADENLLTMSEEVSGSGCKTKSVSFDRDSIWNNGKQIKKQGRRHTTRHLSTSVVSSSRIPNDQLHGITSQTEETEDSMQSKVISTPGGNSVREKSEKDLDRATQQAFHVGLRSLLHCTPCSQTELAENGDLNHASGGNRREGSSNRQSSTLPHNLPVPSHEQLTSYCLDIQRVIDRMDTHGRYPIHVAAIAGRVDIIEQLLNHRCDPTRVLPVDISTQLQASPSYRLPHLGQDWRPSSAYSSPKSSEKERRNSRERLVVEEGKIEQESGIQLCEEFRQVLVERDPLLDHPSLKYCNALHLAAFYGHLTALELLLCRTSIDPSATNEHGCTALHLAANKGHKHIINRLLKSQRSNIDAKDSCGRRPLHHAAAQGRSEIVDILWTRGCEMDAMDIKDCTALHYAAQAGHVDVVTKLIIAGCPVSKYDGCGFTPGHLAAFHGYASVLEKVLHAGFDPDMQGGMSVLHGCGGSTALHMAAAEGHPTVVELLLAEGAYANKKDFRGLNPLQCSAEGGHLEAFNILLQAGCNPQATDTYGTTLLHSAASGGNWDIVRELIDLGCDHSSQTNLGRTVLHHAAQVGAVQVTENLLRLGCDIHVADNEGNMPWHAAAYGGNLKVLELFLSRGCDLEAVNNIGYTALHKASCSGNLATVQTLLKHNANIKAVTTKGQTALHLAAEKGHEEVLTLLIDQVNLQTINLADSKGLTVLHHVVKGESVKLLGLLIERGANVNAKDENEQNALHHATLHHCQLSVETLLASGCDVSMKDCHGCTALHYAAQKDDADIFGLLFAVKSCNVAEKDKRGYGLLHYAVEGGNRDIVSRLISRGAAQYDRVDGSEEVVNALHVACELGHISVVSYLLNASYNVRAKGPNGMEPIHFASGGSRKEITPWSPEESERHHLIVRKLLEEGADPHVVDKLGGNVLMYAAGVGDLKLVMKYLSLEVDPKKIDNMNSTCMHWAAHSGNPEIIEQLMKVGVAIDSKDKRGRLPLHRAAERGNLLAVSAIVDAKGKKESDIHKKDSKGYSPVQLAAAHGYVDVVTKLLEGANTKDVEGVTALHLGIQMKMDDIVKSLLVSGKCNINARDAEGCTPLHYAAESGQEAQVKMLLDAKADMFLASTDGMMPIHRAAAEGHMGVLDELIRHGALNNCTTTSGSTPLHYAASSGRLKVMKHLIRKKISVNQMSSGTLPCTALYCAASNGRLEAVNLLLDHDADVDVVCGSDCTALHIAATNGHTSIVKRLIKAGSDVDFQAANGTAAIHNAVNNGHKETTEALILADCDVDIQNSSCNTPLHIAACKGSQELCQVLLEANCDIHIKNSKGHQAVHSAASNGFLEIVLLLVQNGAPCRQKGDLDVAKMLCRKSNCLMTSYVEGRLRLAERAKHRKAKPMESSETHPTEEEMKDMQAQADAAMAELLAEEEKEKKAGDSNHSTNQRQRNKRNKDKKKRNHSMSDNNTRASSITKSKDTSSSVEPPQDDPGPLEKPQEEEKSDILESMVLKSQKKTTNSSTSIFTEVKSSKSLGESKPRRKETKQQQKSKTTKTADSEKVVESMMNSRRRNIEHEKKMENEGKPNSVTVIRRRTQTQPQVLVKSSTEDLKPLPSPPLHELAPKDNSFQVLLSSSRRPTSALARSISSPEEDKTPGRGPPKRSLTMAAVVAGHSTGGSRKPAVSSPPQQEGVEKEEKEMSGAAWKLDSSHVWADAVKCAMDKKAESKVEVSKSSSNGMNSISSGQKKYSKVEKVEDSKIKVVNVSTRKKAFLPFSEKSLSVEKSVSGWTTKPSTTVVSPAPIEDSSPTVKPTQDSPGEEKTEKEPVLKWVTKELPTPEQKPDLKGSRVVPLTQKLKTMSLNSEKETPKTQDCVSVQEARVLPEDPVSTAPQSAWSNSVSQQTVSSGWMSGETNWSSLDNSMDHLGYLETTPTAFPFPGRSSEWGAKTNHGYYQPTHPLQSSQSWSYGTSSLAFPDRNSTGGGYGIESVDQLDFQHLLPPELKEEITNGGATSTRFRTKNSALESKLPPPPPPPPPAESTVGNKETTTTSYAPLTSQTSACSSVWSKNVEELYSSGMQAPPPPPPAPSSPPLKSNPIYSKIPDDPWEIDEVEMSSVFVKSISEQQSSSPEVPPAPYTSGPAHGHYLCPLSQRPITDPVVAADGITYDRSAFHGNPPPHGYYHPYLAYSNGSSF